MTYRTSVSYTHLDVYKRQDNSSAEFLGGACKDTTGALTTIPNKLSGQHNSSVQPSTITEINTLNQNYPNPFSRKTVISVNLALPMDGTLNITDIQGRVIKSIKRNWNKEMCIRDRLCWKCFSIGYSDVSGR